MLESTVIPPSHTQAFSQDAEDFSHATGRGVEAIQDRTITDVEFLGTARQGWCCPPGLALEILDTFLATVVATADEGVDLFIGDVGAQGQKMGFDGFQWETDNDVFEEAARFSRGGVLDYSASNR